MSKLAASRKKSGKEGKDTAIEVIFGSGT